MRNLEVVLRWSQVELHVLLIAEHSAWISVGSLSRGFFDSTWDHTHTVFRIIDPTGPAGEHPLSEVWHQAEDLGLAVLGSEG